MDNANPQTAPISIAAQIQPEAEAQPVASSEAGELLPCPFCSSSQIEDVMRTGAVVCQDCRASATNNRQWNRRALPAARAEITSLDHPAIDAYWEAKRNTVVTRDINGWRRSVLNGLNAALRALTEAGE